MHKSKRDRERRRENRRIHADSATLSAENSALAVDEENEEGTEMPLLRRQTVDSDAGTLDGHHVVDADADRDRVTARDSQPRTPVLSPQSLSSSSYSSLTRVDPSVEPHQSQDQVEASAPTTLTPDDAAHVETVADPAAPSADDAPTAAAVAVASGKEPTSSTSRDGAVARQDQKEEDASPSGETKKNGTAGVKSEKQCSGRSTYPAMFRELVLIMDAAPLPEPRHKLPGLPEDDVRYAFYFISYTKRCCGSIELTICRCVQKASSQFG